ncbi:Uncharacterized protein FWK35_00017802, partial [Aphis craccivora]
MLIIKNEFKFCFHKELNNNIERWKCIQKQCKAYIKIGKNKEIFFENLNHSRDRTEETNLNRQKLNNKLKRKAVDDICEKPAKLIHK